LDAWGKKDFSLIKKQTRKDGKSLQGGGAKDAKTMTLPKMLKPGSIQRLLSNERNPIPRNAEIDPSFGRTKQK